MTETCRKDGRTRVGAIDLQNLYKADSCVVERYIECDSTHDRFILSGPVGGLLIIILGS